MFSKKPLYFIIGMLFFTQPQVHAFSWTNAFSNTMTGIHGYIVAVPVIGWLKSQYVAYEEAMGLPDASPETNEYAKTILRKHNCPDNIVDNVQIKMGEHFRAQYNFNGKHIIIIPKEFETEFKIDEGERWRG